MVEVVMGETLEQVIDNHVYALDEVIALLSDMQKTCELTVEAYVHSCLPILELFNDHNPESALRVQQTLHREAERILRLPYNSVTAGELSSYLLGLSAGACLFTDDTPFDFDRASNILHRTSAAARHNPYGDMSCYSLGFRAGKPLEDDGHLSSSDL